ncbi:MAG: hypothetical protein KC410_12720 [Anaerolineales bacterium]|nr:hypothetical protein [Anaerolineales bacterium]
MARSTVAVRDAINRLLKLNDYTADAEVSELYLSKDIIVATLKRPKVIEGTCWDIVDTIDIFDLMDLYDNERSA